jgi:hypothetical protein
MSNITTTGTVPPDDDEPCDLSKWTPEMVEDSLDRLERELADEDKGGK